jgi:flagellar hook-length control protein FliK
MQAAAAPAITTKATSPKSEMSAKPAAQSASSDKEGNFEQSLTKASQSDSDSKVDKSTKVSKAKSSDEAKATDKAASTSHTKTSDSEQKVTAKDTQSIDSKGVATAEDESSESFLGSLFSSDETSKGDKGDGSKQTANSSSKAESPATGSDDSAVDENMQQASDLLKRLDESNAALKSEQPKEAAKSSAYTADSVQAHSSEGQLASRNGKQEQSAELSSTTVESDGKLTTAQNLTKSDESVAVKDSGEGISALKEGEAGSNQGRFSSETQQGHTVTSVKQTDEESTTTAEPMPQQSNLKSSNLESSSGESSNLNTAGSNTSQALSSEGIEPQLNTATQGEAASLTAQDGESTMTQVYGATNSDDQIVWDKQEQLDTPNAVTTGVGASTVTAASATTSSAANQGSVTATGATVAGQNAATSPPWSPNSAVHTGVQAPANAVAAGAVSPASPELSGKQQTALAAAGLQIVRNQKSDPNQPEAATPFDSISSQQSQQSLSGLQRLEQAQQAQTPVQVKSDLAADQMAERVQMMMSKNLKNIDIRLDPPELGRMQIRMNMSGDVANVQITVSNPAARELIEQTIPRLREMLAQSGVALADTSVQQQSSRGGQAQQGSDGQLSRGGNNDFDGVAEDEPAIQVSTASPELGISFFA